MDLVYSQLEERRACSLRDLCQEAEAIENSVARAKQDYKNKLLEADVYQLQMEKLDMMRSVNSETQETLRAQLAELRYILSPDNALLRDFSDLSFSDEVPSTTMYYCNAPHIVKVCEAEGLPLAEQDAVTLIAESMHEAEEESKKKFYTHRVDKARQERKDAGAAMLEAETAFAADETVFAYEKKVAGLLKAKLQQKFGKNIDIYKPTEQISDSQFVDIHSAA